MLFSVFFMHSVHWSQSTYIFFFTLLLLYSEFFSLPHTIFFSIIFKLYFCLLPVCHGELNAFLFGNVAEMKNSTLYVTLFPCEECAKVFIRAGIKKVCYYSDKQHDKREDSRKLLKKARVDTE